MKIAVTFRRKSDGVEFVREYEPEHIEQVSPWMAKYLGTCEAVGVAMDEEARIETQYALEMIEKIRAEVANAYAGVWELVKGAIVRVG